MSRKKIRQQLTALTRSMPDMSSTTELTFTRTPYVQFYSKLSGIVGDVSSKFVNLMVSLFASHLFNTKSIVALIFRFVRSLL